MSAPEELWRQALIPTQASLAEAIKSLDATGLRIVLVQNASGELEGTVSDGDIRRGLLRGGGLSTPILQVTNRNPFVIPPGVSRQTVMDIMSANKILQVPIVDEKRHVVGLHVWDRLVEPQSRPNWMVIMAGGQGTRMRPHTENCPKPLIPVAGKPMLEHILERAKKEGFSNFVISLHYLGHMIKEYFGDGSRLGINLSYVKEREPLGTAGALGLIKPSPDLPFVVTNGDVLSDIRYGDLLEFHARNEGVATMAVRTHEFQHPFGVVETSGIHIVGIQEKPILKTHVNAGVYALSPIALSELKVGERCDMTELFDRLRVASFRTIAYPMHEPWLDVGRPVDLAEAEAMADRMKSNDR